MYDRCHKINHTTKIVFIFIKHEFVVYQLFNLLDFLPANATIMYRKYKQRDLGYLSLQHRIIAISKL